MTEFVSELSPVPGRNFIRLGFICLGTLLALMVALYGIAFPLILPEMQDEFHQRYLSMSQTLVYMHVVGAGVALFISPIQFMIYRKNRILHRYMGRVYFLAVMVGSIGGYYMAWYAFGGMISTVGLGILSTLWWSFTLIAVIHARAGNMTAHRRWMIRSFSLTFAAVTLRLLSPFLSMVFDDATTSQIVYWVSWSLNLALAQLWMNWQARTQVGSATRSTTKYDLASISPGFH
ncbi:MAG: hypothetical protein COA96_03155 [SAR86 cluster bacterium]|uniref:DUF2306 domain-containing protein n=1 Tax=SAR86 cluster bacterium TaxID=2030880 RepID=A0A2A5B854_9GAMM|nr:MAG: hypothetical protein COA96_03155 [SAR86 cluster bacterium]